MAKDFTVTRPSPKLVLNKDGVITEFGDNYPAFEFNNDGTYKGILAEETTSNLFLHNEDLSNDAWSEINSVATQSKEETPDGSTENRYIKLVTDDNQDSGSQDGNRLGYQQKFSSLTSGNIYTASVFVKIDQVDQPKYFIIQSVNSTFVNDNIVNSIVYFDLNNNGSVGQQFRNIDAGIEKYSNDWFFCWMTWIQEVEVDENTGVRFDFYGGDGPNQPLKKGTNYSGYLWLAQLEKNKTFSSSIKTTTEQTRAGDVITMSNASQYIPAQGTVIIQWEQKKPSKIYIGALSADVEQGINKLRFQYSSTQQQLFLGDSTTPVDSLTGTFDFSGMGKIELGHIGGFDQPNTNIRYFAII